MDFTHKIYQQLLQKLQAKSYPFLTYQKFLENPISQFVILRHDVDQRPERSLEMARIEKQLNINSTYFFRTIPAVFNLQIIEEISSMEHEIGYQYEDYSAANGDFDKAIASFEKNLEKLRQITPVQSICMEGRPRSRWDNRDLWKKYNYREFGITGEAYFDTDWSQIAYYTDTGRMWDGSKYSVRDKVPDHGFPKYHSTADMIRAIENNTFPKRAMLNVHPQRWTDSPLPWGKELIAQRIKNVVKYWVVKTR
jgi:hypothetical protein